MYIHTETCLKNQDKEAVSRGRSNQMKSQEFASSCLYPDAQYWKLEEDQDSPLLPTRSSIPGPNQRMQETNTTH